MIVTLIKWIVAASAAMFLYTAGYLSAESYYIKQKLAERTVLVNTYEDFIRNLRTRQNELEQQVYEYKSAASSIGNDADRLRAELAAARTVSCSVNQSSASAGTDGGRDAAMADALRIATDLIEERDRIALQYNELRTQCRLQ